ncbi:MAG: hypothetical protein ACTIAQ_09445, partial [Glutamicibacter arilaitensis]
MAFITDLLIAADAPILDPLAAPVHRRPKLICPQCDMNPQQVSPGSKARCYAQLVHFELLLLLSRCEDPKDR